MKFPRSTKTAIRVWLFAVLFSGHLQAAENFADYLANPQAPETIQYAQRGGKSLVLNAFKPQGIRPGEAAPALVLIHGGGWVGGTPDAFMLMARYFATRGMATFNITYRLAKPGESGVEDCLKDCRSALRYIRAHAEKLGVDPNRIAVLGDSAGGHLAAALGTLGGFDHPDDNLSVSAVADAMVLYNPIVDMTEGDWIRFAVGGQALADRKSPRPEAPHEVAAARALSPVFHVKPQQPPALLIHGRADKIVPVSQAERFAAAAEEAGNRCDLIVLEETGHAFVVPAYKSPEPVVVSAVQEADRFLHSLGWISGDPTLSVSAEPAWTLPKK